MPPLLMEIEGSQNLPFPNIYQLCGRDDPWNPQNPQCGGRPVANMMPFNMREPYVIQYNLNVQKQVAKNTVVTLGYVGSRGVRVPGISDLNAVKPEERSGRLVFAAGAAKPNRNARPKRTPGRPSGDEQERPSRNMKTSPKTRRKI